MADNDYLGENAREPSGEVNEHGIDEATTNVVVNEGDATAVTEHDLAVVDYARKVLKEEAEGMEETDGPADTFTGSSSDDPHDHVFSNDPYKKAFPPGPADPSKL